MILLTVDEVIHIYEMVISTTGGTAGIRDRGLLESAVYSADASFDEVEQYPTIEEKAARLAYSLIMNHAFVDGNKRIGIIVMLMTMELNGIKINYTQSELVNLGLSIADGSMVYQDIYEWIIEHKI